MKQDSGARASLRIHGGDLAAARRAFPHAPEPWIDLSTGINPVAYPVGALAADAWQRLPAPGDISALEVAAAQFYGVAEPEQVIAAPGTQSIIQLLPELFSGRRVGILGRSYGGHAQAWRGRAHSFICAQTLEDLTACDVAIVVNPNNPDGRLVAPGDLRALAQQLSQNGGALIVDEAFVDVAPKGMSLAPEAAACGAIVLRSFGKIFGLAGLRLGFAATDAPRVQILRERLGPWAVSGAAVELGRKAFADADWFSATCARLARDAGRLDALLAQAGFSDICGTPLFRLAHHPQALRWFEKLGEAGILVRPFSESADELRFGLPGAEKDWRRLAAALQS